MAALVPAFISVVWVSGCALPFFSGATKLDPKAVEAVAKPDSLRKIANEAMKPASESIPKSAKAQPPPKSVDTSLTPAVKSPDSVSVKSTGGKDSLARAVKSVSSTKSVDSSKNLVSSKTGDSTKSVTPAKSADSLEAKLAKPEQLDPSERSRDPNAWSDLLMAGDTTASRELSIVSRILRRWYKRPVTPMLSAWPDYLGHVGELTFTRSVDTIAVSASDTDALVLDLRPLAGLRKLRASKIGLDKKRLVSILVPPTLEEIDLSGNRLELLEVVAEGKSELRQLDVSNNRISSLRLVGVSPKVVASGNRLCSRLFGLPAGDRADRASCKDFPSTVDSLGRLLLERWSRSGLPGEIAPAKVVLAADILPASLPPTKWTFPVNGSECPRGAVDARFWAFGVLGYEGSDALLVGAFPPLAKGRIRPGMARTQVQAVLGKPTRSQGGVDAWASEKTPDDRLWLGVRFFYDAEGRLEAVWIRRLALSCKS